MAYAEDSLWYYAPSKAAPIIFSALFLLSSLLPVLQCIRYKSWKMTAFLPWGAVVLAAGYATRAAGAWHDDDLKIYIASTLMLVMGPPVYAACLYVTLGRAMYYIPWLAIIHPGRVVTTFIGLDALCEIVLGAGAPRATNTDISNTEREVGVYLIRAGLIVQVILLVFFLALAAHFHRKCEQARVISKIRAVLALLYGTGLLILERSILRVVEQYGGPTGKVYSSEPIFWVLEACPMLIVTFVLHIWHPGRLLPSCNKIYLATNGITEREGPGWVDKRPFIFTLFDPFNFAGLLTKKGRAAEDRFWERDLTEAEVLQTQHIEPKPGRNSSV